MLRGKRIVVVLALGLCLPVFAADKEADKQKWLAALKEQIKGKERRPASEVFQNIQFMKNTPASRLLAIMDIGFSRSLGVGCDHCHVPEMWDDDSKTPKRIARQMSAMTNRINKELLPAIVELQDREPLVNCTTCHRGALRPALDIVGDPK
jgi:hypothetical protein